MTLTHRRVPAEEPPPPRPAPATAGRYQNQILDELLHRCAQHDEAGLARLYELTSPFIYALVTRLTSSASVADSAMVAIYAKIWRQAARHDGDRSVLAWMTTIAGEETRTIRGGSQPQNTGLHEPAHPNSTAKDARHSPPVRSTRVVGPLSIAPAAITLRTQQPHGGRTNERRGT